MWSPPRFIIARKHAGLSRAALAARVGVSAQTMGRWETSGPPPDRVAALARELDVLPGFFSDPSEEPIEEVIERKDCYFRSLARTPASDRIRCEGLGDKVRLILRAVDELAPDALTPVRLPTSTLLENAGEAVGVGIEDASAADLLLQEINPAREAIQVRERLGLGSEPILNVVELLESLGIVVVIVPDLSADTVDAFSFWKDRPVVVLNYAKKDPYRSRFDALHELAHLCLHTGVLAGAEPSGRSRRAPDQRLEGQANAFAGAMLVPAGPWTNDAPRSTNPYSYLARRERWGASAAALMYRAKVCGVLNDRQFRSAMVRYSSLGWRQGEPPVRSGVQHEQPRALRQAVRTTCERLGWSLAKFAGYVGIPKRPLLEIMAPLAIREGGGKVVSLSAFRATEHGDVQEEPSSRPQADIERIFGEHDTSP
ncbi:MAG: ImmA/IrrE family metallo-endopeptidase [Alphaproteobacteria bacterium]|nr:ImmA/IrrE family metallo-endopeptidase [Alphaproteobacteria bacterium]